MNVSSSGASNNANVFLGLIEYELNSLLSASHLADYISVHIRFDLERYLLNININLASKNIIRQIHSCHILIIKYKLDLKKV